jgi:hypothetical protein
MLVATHCPRDHPSVTVSNTQLTSRAAAPHPPRDSEVDASSRRPQAPQLAESADSAGGRHRRASLPPEVEAARTPPFGAVSVQNEEFMTGNFWEL